MAAERQPTTDDQMQAEGDGEKPREERCGFAWPELSKKAWGGIIFLAFLVIISCVAYLWLGPQALLRVSLRLLVPRKPGWHHALFLGLSIAILMVVPLPIAWFVLLIPGMLFGFWIGLLIILPSLFVGIVVASVVGRFFLQEPIREWIDGEDCPRPRMVLSVLEGEQDCLTILVLFRFLNMPYSLRNYGPCILRISLGRLILSTVPHSIFQAVLFASLGAMFQDTAQLMRNGHQLSLKTMRLEETILFAASLISVVLLGWYAWRIYSRSQAHAEEAGTSAGDSEARGEHSETYGACQQ